MMWGPNGRVRTWIYDHLFAPCNATMFSLLAFFVVRAQVFYFFLIDKQFNNLRVSFHTTDKKSSHSIMIFRVQINLSSFQ